MVVVGDVMGEVSAICQSSRNGLTNELAISGRSLAAPCKDLKNTAAADRSFVYKGILREPAGQNIGDILRNLFCPLIADGSAERLCPSRL